MAAKGGAWQLVKGKSNRKGQRARAPGPMTHAMAMQQALATVGMFRTYGIHFDFDKASIRSESQGLINDMATTLKNNPLWTLRITGYTDSIGDPAYNQKLSVRRANVVVEALVDMGARRAAIQVSGVGESDLAVATEDGVKEARNRRAVIDLLP